MKVYEQQRWNVARAIYDAELPEVEQTLIEGLQFSIRILTGWGMAPPGASKIGGVPDLPEGSLWPEWNGEPLSFLAQFDMAELSQWDLTGRLPTHGMLYFFITEEAAWTDLTDPSAWQVLYVENPPANARWSLPPDNLPLSSRFRNSAVDFRPTVTLPSFDIPKSWNDRAFERFSQLQNRLNAIDGEHLDTRHRVFGNADWIQHNHHKALETMHPGRNWRLLLQLGSDERTGMMWGDVGTVYFYISQTALELRKFDHCRVFCDCH